VPSLAPICRNVPDDPNLQTAIPQRPYQVSADKLNEVQPVTSDRELFSVSATSVFESIDEQQLRNKQQAEYGEYIRYIENEDAPLPEHPEDISHTNQRMRRLGRNTGGHR